MKVLKHQKTATNMPFGRHSGTILSSLNFELFKNTVKNFFQKAVKKYRFSKRKKSHGFKSDVCSV